MNSVKSRRDTVSSEGVKKTWRLRSARVSKTFRYSVLLAAILAVFAIRTRIGDDLLSVLAFALGSIPSIAVLPLLVLSFGASTDSLILIAICEFVG